jgi:hypothetical protein
MTYWEGKLFGGFPLASKRAILGSIAVCAGQGDTPVQKHPFLVTALIIATMLALILFTQGM